MIGETLFSASTLGISMIEFAGCDYLGLRRHPALLAAAQAMLEATGIGAGASRMTTGSHPVHDQLEAESAATFGGEAALLFPSGALANLTLGATLFVDGPKVWVDERSHPSLSAALAFGGTRVETPAEASVFLTDGLFPSRGERAHLDALLDDLPEEGWLVVDDCHGWGVVGPGGRGSVAAAGIDDPRVIITSTFSKALGSAGGIVVASSRLREQLAAHPLHVGSTALSPALAAAGLAALHLLRDDRTIHGTLTDRIRYAQQRFSAASIPVPPIEVPVFRITPPPGVDHLEITARLENAGLFVPHIHYPDGPPEGYLRAVVSAARTEAEIDALTTALAAVFTE